MRFRTAITGLALLIFATLASEVLAAEKIRILAFGDSLTAGYQLPQSVAWPAQLELLLQKKGHSVEVINSGVSGDTSAQGLRRTDWILKRGPYDVVLLGLGANDGMRNLPLKDLELQLGSLIDRFKATHALVILLGMKIPTNQDPTYRKQFEAIYPRLAKDKAIPLYPFLLEGVATKELMNLDDQMHPNAEGHKVIAQNLLPSIESLVKKREKQSSH